MTEKSNLAAFETASNAVEGEVLRPVFIVRWMEHEYEEGWGVDDKDDTIDVFKTFDEAAQSVTDYFDKRQGKRTLLGAGDYFIYPSGPDNAYWLHEVYLPVGHNAHKLLETNAALIIPRLPREEDDRKLRRDLVEAMQRNLVEAMQRNIAGTRHTVEFKGLAPKPLTGEPVIMFFNEPSKPKANI